MELSNQLNHQLRRNIAFIWIIDSNIVAIIGICVYMNVFVYTYIIYKSTCNKSVKVLKFRINSITQLMFSEKSVNWHKLSNLNPKYSNLNTIELQCLKWGKSGKMFGSNIMRGVKYLRGKKSKTKTRNEKTTTIQK